MPFKSQSQVGQILQILKTMYPSVKTQLDYRDPFELLIATILSAQCTDKQVNMVTRELFARFPGPAAMVAATQEAIEEVIRPTGFFRNKAGNIKSCSQALMERYDGEVPRTLEALVTLPGVGRKTANVVLGAAFGVPGIVVDTHVARIAGRLGLTAQKDPVKIERDLMEAVPRAKWSDFSLQLIYFGREVCVARKPKCWKCPLTALCDYPDKNLEKP